MVAEIEWFRPLLGGCVDSTDSRTETDGRKHNIIRREKLWNESVSGTREAWAAREARAARETVGVGEAGGRARRGRRGRRGGPRPPPSELELERACAAYSEALTAKLPIEAHASGCAVRHTGLEPRTSRPQTGLYLLTRVSLALDRCYSYCP